MKNKYTIKHMHSSCCLTISCILGIPVAVGDEDKLSVDDGRIEVDGS